MDLFKDLIASLNSKEPGNLMHSDSPDEALKAYAPFIVNRNYSQDRATIGYADIANHRGFSLLPKEAHYDFYFHALPKTKRFTRWAKADQEEKDIGIIMQIYGYNRKRAEEVYPLISKEDMDTLRKKVAVGRER